MEVVEEGLLGKRKVEEVLGRENLVAVERVSKLGLAVVGEVRLVEREGR